MIIDVVVDYDAVTLAGVKVPKPSHIGSTEWLEFWEAISDLRDLRTAREDLEAQLAAAHEEIEDLKDRIADLEARDAE